MVIGLNVESIGLKSEIKYPRENMKYGLMVIMVGDLAVSIKL